MFVSLILTEKAEEDLDDAYHWYEEQEPGLGKKVIRCIDAKIANINRYPFITKWFKMKMFGVRLSIDFLFLSISKLKKS